MAIPEKPSIGFSEVWAMEGGFSVRLTRLLNGHVEVRLIHDAVNIACRVASFRWERLMRDLPGLNADGGAELPGNQLGEPEHAEPRSIPVEDVKEQILEIDEAGIVHELGETDGG